MNDEILATLREIQETLIPLMRVLAHRTQDEQVDAARQLINCRIEQERDERNDRAFIAGLECALWLIGPTGEQYVAKAYLSEVDGSVDKVGARG